MAFDYQPLVDEATRLIGEFGREVSRVSGAGVTVDPVTGEPVSAPLAAQTIVAVITTKDIFRAEIGVVVTQLRIITVSAITDGDRIVDGGRSYTVKGLNVVAPGPLTLLYDAELVR